MKNYIKKEMIIILILPLLFSACSQKKEILANNNTNCFDNLEIKSLTQQIKNMTLSQSNFYAKIHNLSNINPLTSRIKLEDVFYGYTINNLILEIPEINLKKEIKNVFILPTKKNTLDELKKILYKFKNNFISIGEVSRIYQENNFNLNIPYNLQKKIIRIEKNKIYSLNELFYKIGENLFNENIHTSFEIKDNNIIINMLPLNFNLKNETFKKLLLEKLTNERIKYNLTNNSSIEIYGDYKIQNFYKNLYSKKNIFQNNKYVICINNKKIIMNNDEFHNINDNDQISISEIEENENNFSKYKITYKNKNSEKYTIFNTNKKIIKFKNMIIYFY